MLCWRSVNLYYLLQISRPRQLSCLFCCEFYPLCFFLCYFSSYYPSVKALCVAAVMLTEDHWVVKVFYCVNVFQGGYNLTSLPQSVCQTVQTLLGDPAPPPTNLDGPCQRSVSKNSHVRPLTCLCVCVYNCSECICLFFQCT